MVTNNGDFVILLRGRLHHPSYSTADIQTKRTTHKLPKQFTKLASFDSAQFSTDKPTQQSTIIPADEPTNHSTVGIAIVSVQCATNNAAQRTSNSTTNSQTYQPAVSSTIFSAAGTSER